MPANAELNAQGNRARGWILVVLGPVLSIGMGLISFWIWRAINYQSIPGTTSRWTGSHEMTVNTFSLLATIFVFGLVCTGAGVYQIKTGRRNIAFLVAILLLVGVMFYFGSNIMQKGR